MFELSQAEMIDRYVAKREKMIYICSSYHAYVYPEVSINPS